MKETKAKKLWNYSEAAEFLGLKKSTLYSMVSHHRVPCYHLSQRCVRFDPAKLAEWLREREQMPAAAVNG
jgi:excisionase family DNA binding protein